MSLMKRLVVGAFVGLAACAAAGSKPLAPAATPNPPASSAPPDVGDLRRVGTVDFPTSCSPRVQDDFLRGVALLHSFFYEEARRIFSDIAARDPQCAIAEWGVAMTWYHPIWTPPTDAERASGRDAVKRAIAIGAKTERERDYISALDAFYESPADDGGSVGQSCHGPGGGHTPRAMAYTKAPREIASGGAPRGQAGQCVGWAFRATCRRHTGPYRRSRRCRRE